MPNLHSSGRIIKVLERHGFEFVSQRGSHKKFRKGANVVIVSDPKKEVPMGTFHSILRQSGLKKENFKIP
jgi:predicted RNA binding protein YcfA (HicA-like mRNA interferase family)